MTCELLERRAADAVGMDRVERFLAGLQPYRREGRLIFWRVQPQLRAQLGHDGVVSRSGRLEDEGRGVQLLGGEAHRSRLAEHPADDLPDAQEGPRDAVE